MGIHDRSDKDLKKNRNKWVAHERIEESNRTRLLCFPFPGGSASYFAPWKKKISATVDLIPVLYPLREVRSKEKMPGSFIEFVREFVDENEELFSKPYAFFGYCGGATVAFEASIYATQKYGRGPSYGMVASSEAPEYLRDRLPEVDASENTERMLEYLSNLGIFDASILQNDMFLKYYLPIFTADCDLYRTYQYVPGRKIDCDLDILVGFPDPSVAEEKAVEWKDVTNGSYDLKNVEGGHFFVDSKTDEVCDLLNRKLRSLEGIGETTGIF